KAELASLIRLNGTLKQTHNHIRVTIQTENAAIARRIYSLIKDLFDVQAEISVRRRMKLNKNNVYFIRLNQQAKQILIELEIFQVMLYELSLSKSIKGTELNDQTILL